MSEPSSPRRPSRAPSPSSNGDLALETSLSNVSLSSEFSQPEAGPSRISPRPTPTPLDIDDAGDIGVSLTSPTRASSPAPPSLERRPSLSPRRSSHQIQRVFTRSPSPSPRQRSLTPVNGHLQISPTKSPLPSPTSLSPPASAPPSRRSFSFRSSRSSSPPPQPNFLNIKPPLPNVTSVILADEGENRTDPEADSAPFESIPLHSSTPPPEIPSVPLPSSPRFASPDKNGKRQSWGGFGMTKDGQPVVHGETPDHTRSQTEGSRRTSSVVSLSVHQENGVEEGATPQSDIDPSATPRLHAPPAHPFPFPIPSSSTPTSPPPLAHKRLSTASSTGATPQPAPPQIPNQAHGIGAKGVSTFEKMRSHTRPSWLPPKDRHEDEVHLHQWEEMMAQSREHEKQMRKAAEARRKEKEKHMSLQMPLWESLLADKEFSVNKVQNDQKLRRLWFEGIPSHLRGKAWSLAIGNPLAVSKDAYKAYNARARKAIDSGRFPQAILDQMENDLDDTLPTLKMFHRGSPLRDDLRELVGAWVVYRSDEGLGYAPYINLLCAMFILVSPPSEAFIALINLLSRPCLRAFFTQTEDEIDAYYRVLENLQADSYPKIYANCKNLGLRVPESWFRGMLVEQVPFECSCRLWDQIMLDGDGFIFRAALAIFGFLEPRLYYPDHDEILSVLEGHNPATLAIQARERERAKLRGEAFDDSVDGKLSVFGLNETVLFDLIAEDGWKERAFERLVLREMPD
ncbi:hypothetical protein I317_05510 [Kwoniella heveanensis CBS 569]|uniref:Rab-GAP TBC domain-containing protein n=1 Tax=Kwoniella heveanensis BCC8398 TaxID=1296120 RepID=A0A1B9GTJ3_9TREE|nr:hypothetical protein I316_03847 [Kwoniella heveanensis BCC8398]OCF40661.1 hypothetical protein I317_05510 [Kwoniella heveanensis CBS 569]